MKRKQSTTRQWQSRGNGSRREKPSEESCDEILLHELQN
jgi:hypothetical protein